MRNLKIELLYFEDCPSWKMAQESLEAILQDSNIEATVQLVRVETDQEAKDHHFVGSPSIRVDGNDLFPVNHENYALGCRVYQTPDGMRGWPTAKMIEDALTARLS
ncbi:MAG: thioredoxin family protein [Anaerolineales bacterium]